MTTEELLPQLDHVTKGAHGWTARCPAHDDHDPSLSITTGDDGRILFYCHTGCPAEAICTALGISMADLFPEKPGRNGAAMNIIATYDYRDADGTLLMQVCRLDPKDFLQRRPDSSAKGGWVWNTKGVKKVLFRLQEIVPVVRARKPVFVCEGEKDCLAMVAQGFEATTMPGGAKKGKVNWHKSYSETLRGTDTIIVADKDETGRAHARAVATALLGMAATVKMIECPDVDGKTVKDAADFFGAGGQACDLDQLVQDAPCFAPGPDPPTDDLQRAIADSRPKVQLPGDDHLLSETAEAVGKILAKQDIFSRGGLVFTLDKDNNRLVLMTPDTLRTWIEDYLVLYKVRELNGSTIEFKRTITESDAKGILGSPQFKRCLRPIERLNPIRVPVMQDGVIRLLPEGYDAETKSFTFNPVNIHEMPATDAKKFIDELLSEFVFVDASRSKPVAIAGMFTVFGFGLLPRKSLRPCFIYMANAEGAGKGLLVKCATVPVLGHAPVGTIPKDEDEMKKHLLTAVLEAQPVIFFDNVKRHLDSGALEGFLTAQTYGGRVLGVSKSFQGENNTVVFITGNGCTLSPDMRRRSLFCEIFMEAERAEDRVFRNDLEAPALLARRAEIVSAWWALIQDWDQANRPKPSRRNSSFPEWSDIVGGIVQHAGYGCALETPQIESAADMDGADMRALVKAIAAGSILKVVDFEAIVESARAGGLFARLITDEGEMDARTKATLAVILKRYDKRLVGGYRFTLLGKGRTRRFQVEEIRK